MYEDLNVSAIHWRNVLTKTSLLLGGDEVMVDRFAVLGIEFCLLERLSEMLSSEIVMNLDDAMVQEIAAEDEDSQIERVRALTKLQSLEAGLQTLRRLERYQLVGK